MKKVHVYSHTHWDYEWYFTSNESIIQLVYHMDEVIMALLNHDIETYVLDSQVSILEQYLAIMPSKEKEVRQLIEEKRLLIGPWYTQSDELIIAGESMARNLWYGIQYARKLGNCMHIGYLPDSFGQSKDMPKIYNGFNIPYCLFWRGVSKDICKQREFIWQSNDGSKVLTYNIKDGYFYGGNIIYNDDIETVETKMLDGASTNVQLLPVGGDQRYVDFNLKERIQYYNDGSVHDFMYQESDLETFFKELEIENNLPVIQGEFIDPSVSKIHHSIYSSRYDHKQINDRVERRILYQLEPFMVMQQVNGIPPKTSVLESLWKKLLLNHAHDSACGCNSDQTNQSILQRLLDCDQMSSMLLDYQVRKYSESINGIQDNDLCVYNTLPYTRLDNQKMLINTKSKYFEIYDEENNIVKFDIIEQVKEYSGSIRKDISSYDKDKFYYQTTICMFIDIPAMSYKKYTIKELTNQKIENNIFKKTSIENTRYQISIEKGICYIYDKKMNKHYHNAIIIEDSGDDGDTYDYSNPSEDYKCDLDFKNASIVSMQGQIMQRLQIKGSWLLPYNLVERSKHNCTTKVPYTLTISLHHDYIHIDVHVDNTVIEHRMRVLIDAGIFCKYSYADTPYGIIQRDTIPTHIHDWKEQGYKEEPTPIYPMIHHVSIYDKDSTCSVFSKGIKEYEIVDQRKIALTLFRSVSYLGKPDLQRRPGIASGNEFKYVETPDSRLLKPLSFSIAFQFYDSYQEAKIFKDWMLYANDIVYYQMQEYNRFVNTQKYFVTHPYSVPIKAMEPLINMEQSQNIVLSSILPLDNKTYLIRIFNPSDKILTHEKIMIKNVKKITEVNFLCDMIKEEKIYEDILDIAYIAPEEIKTYKVTL